jgi:dTDP-4-dehydrorhamnose reductase
VAALCARRGIRLIHVSTDCVFSGRRGSYTERDEPDPVDLYGRSKLLGEPSGPGVLTLRTSMIGWELSGRRQGLLEWFASQAGATVDGYTRAIFSGPTAPVLARVIVDVAERHPNLEGLWHVGAEPIAKHDLLLRLRDALALPVEVAPKDEVVIDRSLDSSRFRAETGWSSPSWDEMVAELAATRAEEDTLARR